LCCSGFYAGGGDAGSDESELNDVDDGVDYDEGDDEYGGDVGCGRGGDVEPDGDER
jgi:hypothetical protein